MTSELIKVLDAADAAAGAAELRRRTYELLGPGRVVDVGCGAGTAVAELGADAVGVDLSEEMIAAGRLRWPEADLRVGSAYELPFRDGELAGYRAERVYHDLDQVRAITEARRVLAPGGRIVLLGQDWDGILIDSDEPELARRLVRERADRITAPRSARGYRTLLRDAGFSGVELSVVAAVLPDALALPIVRGLGDDPAWIADQEARAREGRMTVVVPFFLAWGTR